MNVMSDIDNEYILEKEKYEKLQAIINHAKFLQESSAYDWSYINDDAACVLFSRLACGFDPDSPGWYKNLKCLNIKIEYKSKKLEEFSIFGNGASFVMEIRDYGSKKKIFLPTLAKSYDYSYIVYILSNMYVQSLDEMFNCEKSCQIVRYLPLDKNEVIFQGGIKYVITTDNFNENTRMVTRNLLFPYEKTISILEDCDYDIEKILKCYGHKYFTPDLKEHLLDCLFIKKFEEKYLNKNMKKRVRKICSVFRKEVRSS